MPKTIKLKGDAMLRIQDAVAEQRRARLFGGAFLVSPGTVAALAVILLAPSKLG